MNDETAIQRRTVLRTAAGAAGSVAALSAVPRASAQSDFGGWLSETSNYDGTVADRTGQGEVTVTVGARGNGGNFAFGPPAVRIDPGTTVRFEWNGKGGQHNVRAMEGAEFESDLYVEAGVHFEHTFESEGIVKYQCDPHAALGMKGVVVVGDVSVGGGDGEGGTGDGAAGGQKRPDWGGWLEGVDGGYTDARGRNEVTVEVGADGNGGSFAFAPAGLWIDPGTTVTFEWVSDNHNVVPESVPNGWEGHQPLENTGFSYEHTFESGGIYTYFCDPHRSLGMKGAIAVGDGVPTVSAGGGGAGGAGGGDGGDGGRPLPGGDVGATVMGFLLGGAGLAAFAVLAAEFYAAVGRSEPVTGEEELAPGEVAEAPAYEPERELGHDEFDPTGTASLIVVYFLILLVLWVFVYFVEFLGRGPTVIG